MTRFASKLAAGLEPYTPGEQPKDKKYVKLNTNENPYPPSGRVLEAVNEAAADLRLYPDPDATDVRTAAKDYYNQALNLSGSDKLTIENIFVGNGSDEVLAFVFPTFFKDKTIAFADITYSFYPVYAALFEVKYEIIPLESDFSINVDDYLEQGAAKCSQGILLCNPNAPTSKALKKADIERILTANREKLVVVDEAYVDFGAETLAGEVNKYDNLLVTQTLSKSRQMAGMRLGLAIGCRDLINALNAVKNSFNSYTADRIAIAAAKAAFEDVEYFEKTRNQIQETRKKTVVTLEKLGFDVVPSSSNFIFVQPPHIKGSEAEGKTDAGYLFTKLREEGVLVRYFNKPRIDNRLRISIGTDEEMNILVEKIEKIIS